MFQALHNSILDIQQEYKVIVGSVSSALMNPGFDHIFVQKYLPLADLLEENRNRVVRD